MPHPHANSSAVKTLVLLVLKIRYVKSRAGGRVGLLCVHRFSKRNADGGAVHLIMILRIAQS